MHMPTSDTMNLSLLAANDQQARHNRQHFDDWGLFCINVMSSPGAGKTVLLEQTLRALAEQPGVSAVVETAPGDWKKDHPVFHPPPSAAVASLSRRIKSAFDPDGILAPGRMPF